MHAKISTIKIFLQLNVLDETCYLYEPEFETLPPNIQEVLKELQQEFDEGMIIF